MARVGVGVVNPELLCLRHVVYHLKDNLEGQTEHHKTMNMMEYHDDGRDAHCCRKSRLCVVSTGSIP